MDNKTTTCLTLIGIIVILSCIIASAVKADSNKIINDWVRLPDKTVFKKSEVICYFEHVYDPYIPRHRQEKMSKEELEKKPPMGTQIMFYGGGSINTDITFDVVNKAMKE